MRFPLLMEWIFLTIIGIGVIVAGIFGLAILIAGWWFLIPIICALIGGWIGFFFGVGVVVIIGVIVSAIDN